MPDVRGMYAADVVPSLEKMGLVVQVEGRAGRIARQSLAKGSPIRRGTKVILTAK